MKNLSYQILEKLYLVDNMDERTDDINGWAIKAGFSKETANALNELYKFATNGKKPSKNVYDKWEKIGFIQKDKDGDYKAALDDDMIDGNGIAWILAGLAYDGYVERVIKKTGD